MSGTNTAPQRSIGTQNYAYVPRNPAAESRRRLRAQMVAMGEVASAAQVFYAIDVEPMAVDIQHLDVLTGRDQVVKQISYLQAGKVWPGAQLIQRFKQPVTALSRDPQHADKASGGLLVLKIRAVRQTY